MNTKGEIFKAVEYKVILNRGGFLMDVFHAFLQSSLTPNPTIKGCQIHIVIQTFEFKH